MTNMRNPPHPGKTLREDVLPALGLTVTAAAKHLRLPHPPVTLCVLEGGGHYLHGLGIGKNLQRLHHLVFSGEGDRLHVNGQASLHGFINIAEQFGKGFRLGHTARYGRNIRPETAFFCFVNNDFKFHGCLLFVRPQGTMFAIRQLIKLPPLTAPASW